MVTGVPSEPEGGTNTTKRALVPIGVALAATAVVTVVSYAPVLRSYSDTLVGLTFLVVTYFAVLRHDTAFVRRHGLALGGLLEPEPIDAKRVARDAVRAVAWAFGVAVVVFPAFWIGWVRWWKPESAFSPAGFGVVRDDALPQLLAIALPEEAFYRGYLQSSLDGAWAPRFHVLGARIGPSIVVTSALFALGHVATEVHPNRLGVFFPSLLFGWLRARTGGVGACIVFHALCNVFADYIAKSYGFGG
jgi:membrane protease YdiL (CAAX protease family)